MLTTVGGTVPAPLSRRILFRLATSERFERSVRGIGVTERIARRRAQRYVAGETYADAEGRAFELLNRGVHVSLDQFGESIQTDDTADRVASEYRQLAAREPRLGSEIWLSADLSHLGLDVDADRCAARLESILEAMPPGRRLQVGGEQHARAGEILRIVTRLADGGHADRLGATLQANLRRAADDLPQLIDIGVYVRLVKGAYVESPWVAFPYGAETDAAFARLARRLAAEGASFALATHDRVLRDDLLEELGRHDVEQLLGIRHDDMDRLLDRSIPVRAYVPFGSDWFRYWMRRVAEARGDGLGLRRSH